MENGTHSWVAGVGTIRIRMFDGVVQTVMGVRHVLGLKGNLISLGTLDARGYRYSSQGGAFLQRSCGSFKRRNVWRIVQTSRKCVDG